MCVENFIPLANGASLGNYTVLKVDMVLNFSLVEKVI